MAVHLQLLAVPVLAATLTISTGSDRDWWRSSAGTVTEHRQGNEVTCTLILKDHDGQTRFMWNDKLPLRVIIERPGWSLLDDRMWTVSLRIGRTWLVGTDGNPNIPAFTGRHSLKFLVGQPIVDLLGTAHDLTVRTPDRGFDLSIPSGKMRHLVAALRKCMAQIPRVQASGG